MKLLLSTLLLSIGIISTNAQTLTTLTGKIINPTGEKVHIIEISEIDGQRKIIGLDTVSLNTDGSFELSFKIDKPIKASFSDGNESTNILFNPGDAIQMTLNTLFFDETIIYTGTGSEKNNAVMNIYLVEEAIVNSMMSQAENETDTNVIFKPFEKSYEKIDNLILDYKNTYPSFSYWADDFLEESIMKKKMYKKHVISQIELKKIVNSLKGKPAIDFTGVNLKGEKTSLSDYRGKITVIDFWATWCGPCRAEFPAYLALEEKYGGEINFVSVAISSKEESWKKMATEQGFKNNIYLSKEDKAQIADYGVRFIPRYIVLDSEFNIIDGEAPKPSSGELEKYWIE